MGVCQLCPAGLIDVGELPEGWGLIEYDGKRLKKVLSSSEFVCDNRWDMIMMSSILVREGIKQQTFNYRFKSTVYDERYHMNHATDEMRNEYLKCRDDFEYFKEKYIKFTSKDG